MDAIGRRCALVGAIVLGVTATAGATPGAFEPRPLPAVADEGSIAAIAIGDVDGDGDRDVYLAFANRTGAFGIETPLPDRLLLNSGGAFEPAAATFDAAAPAAAAGVVMADFDRDGDLDVLVAGGGSYNGSSVVTASTQVFRNLGGGSFAAPQAVGIQLRSTGVASADIDGDGDADVAIARANGRVDLYRNDSPVGGTINLTLLQQVTAASGPSPELGALAFGDFTADGRPDLAVLRVADSGTAGNVEPRGVVYFENRTTAGFVQTAAIALPEGTPTGLAVADFDLDGRADVVVSATRNFLPFAGETSGASRVLRSTATGPVIAEARFPAHSHAGVAAGDLDADGRPDILFARRRCTPTVFGCLDDDLSSLVIYFGAAGGFQAGPQCLGAHVDAARVVAIGPLDGDALADIVFSGQRPPQGGDGLGWLANNAVGSSNACCVAETAGDLADGAPRRALLGATAAAVDVGALARVRDVLMADASNGTRLRNRYAQFSPEVVALMRNDPTLWRDAATTLGLWARPVRDLVDGRGNQRFVDQSMIDAVDAFLQRLSTSGSPALAAAIADERSRLPAFNALVGLSMTEFRDVALPPDLVLRDGFEAP